MSYSQLPPLHLWRKNLQQRQRSSPCQNTLRPLLPLFTTTTNITTTPGYPVDLADQQCFSSEDCSLSCAYCARRPDCRPGCCCHWQPRQTQASSRDGQKGEKTYNKTHGFSVIAAVIQSRCCKLLMIRVCPVPLLPAVLRTRTFTPSIMPQILSLGTP